MSRSKKPRVFRSAARSNPLLGRHLRTLGEHIRYIRLLSELTQERVASVAKIDAKHYQAIEAGRVNVTMSTLVAIARGLNVDVVALFARNA